MIPLHLHIFPSTDKSINEPPSICSLSSTQEQLLKRGRTSQIVVSALLRLVSTASNGQTDKTDRQTDKETDSQTDRQTDNGQADRQTVDIRTDRLKFR